MRSLRWAVFFSGLAAVIAQVLVIREGLVLFGGNELVSGILLCFWLIWVGVGSLIFTKLKLNHDPRKVYSGLLFVLGFFVIFSMTFLRFVPKIFSLPFGEVIALDKIIFIAMISIAPTGMVIGAFFPAAAKALDPEKVYLIEGLGSFFGGILISFVLIQILPPYGILVIVIFLLIFFGLLLTKSTRLLFLPFVVLLFFIKIYDIEFFFRKMQMGGPNLIGLKESKYGVLAVTKSGSQWNFYTNGVYDFSCPDLYSSEEAVHYPLLLHESPKKVLLVGGGIGNCITQIFKHPDVEEITYLELDPLLFEMGERYLGSNLKDFKNLNVIFGDARLFIKNAKEQYDVIIINLPDPVNGQLNRFYTKEFFAETKKAMKRGAILSVRTTSPPDIVGPLFGQLLNTVYKSLNTSFSNILVLPVAKTTFIATDEPTKLEDIVSILKMRIKERNLDLSYVNDYFFDYNLSNEKLEYLKTRIGESKGVLNTDLKPVCYYFTTILWGGVISENLKKAFIFMFSLNPIPFLLSLLFVLLFFRRRAVIYLSVFSVGASAISAEIILIILFQILYGYLYGWIGAIIAFYMLGLALGTLCYLKSPLFRGNLITKLSNLEFLLSLYLAIIILISYFKLSGITFLIPILILLGGFLGGLHFPISIGVLQREKAGLVYSVDLFGSSLGALLTSVIFVPVLGIIFTLFIFLLLNLLIGIGLRTVKI